MGKNISCRNFTETDFLKFKDHLRHETALLSQWFKENKFDNKGKSIGMEIETWLVDADFLPAPRNEEFLKKLNHPNVVAELSCFNAELNVTPQNLDPSCLSRMQADITQVWSKISSTAKSLGLNMLMIGSLPTLRDEHLSTATISNRDRYKALNDQIMQLKAGLDMRIAIDGKDSLRLEHHDVMMEAATTSMQIHLKTPADQINRYFNASIIASAPLVAAAANTPFIFGKDLWDESRIPVFEQAVSLPGFFDADGYFIDRVGFGSGYVRDSLLEFFLENLTDYPSLLPLDNQEAREHLSHLLLHHGTIWRWNRPIVGLGGSQSQPHLRIEQRVCPAGPTIVDTIANTAFFIGLCHGLAMDTNAPEGRLSFDQARRNFYGAAQKGLSAPITWMDGQTGDLQSLILHHLLPLAKQGLLDLGIAKEEIYFYLDEIMQPRLMSGQNGAAWQRAFIETQGADFQKLTAQYFSHQESGKPVHLWTI